MPCRRPDVHFFCSPSYDPFLFIQDENRIYGFTIPLPTIPALCDAIKEFMGLYPDLLVCGSEETMINEGRETYNNCLSL
ncbi:hypothetical protein K438DRAFT_1843595 [Mycena galopus ATCC 62051]|nr:hypothetical protein K438DRAFT_1871204 [Mycena galopus ATCC 62051]KAF8179110.1 hypothetical protein K438DRAFT_1843595 [Mycena galopus ATCC 62051]